MKSRIFPCLLFASFALSLSGTSMAASILLNGSFEEVSGGTIDNWVQVLDATSQPASNYGSSSPYGALLLALNANSVLPGNSATQDFAPTMAGETYRVEFAYAQFGGAAGDQTLTVTLNSTSAPIPAQLFTDFLPTSDIATGWQRASFTFVSNGFVSGITFSDPTSLGAATSDLLIDDVSITPVPEPGSIAMIAVCGLCSMIRRRR